MKLLITIVVLAAIGCRSELPMRCDDGRYCDLGSVCSGSICLLEPDSCNEITEGKDCVGAQPSLCRGGECVIKSACELCGTDRECHAQNDCVVTSDACDDVTEGLACHGQAASVCHGGQCVPALCGERPDRPACSEATGTSLDVRQAKVAGGDFNGDGRLSDLMVLYDHDRRSAGLWIFPGAEERREGASQPYRVWLAEPEYFDVKRAKVAGGDFNRDGHSDLLALHEYHDGLAGLWIFPGTRSERTDASRPYLVWNARSPFDVDRAKVAAGDFDGDGWTDLMVVGRDAAGLAGLWIFPGVTERRIGSSEPYRIWSAGPQAFDVHRANVAATDFNGDKRSDLLALYDFGGGESGLWMFSGTTSRAPGGTEARLLWRAADRYVRDPSTTAFDISLTKVIGRDFNGDDFGDLVVIYDNAPDSTSIGVFVNAGNAAMLDEHYQVGNWPPNGISSRGIQSTGGDIDGDGYSDLMVLYDYTHLGGSPAARLFVFPGAPGATELAETDYILWSSPRDGL